MRDGRCSLSHLLVLEIALQHAVVSLYKSCTVVVSEIVAVPWPFGLFFNRPTE